MSKADEKIEKFKKHWEPDIEGDGGHVGHSFDMELKELLQTHTNQTLQELGEKVKHENGYIEGNVELLAKYHVLQLIEEAKQ